MKKAIIFLIVLCSSMVSAQFNSSAPWMKELEAKRKVSKSTQPLKFQEIVDAFEAYWEDKDPTQKGSGYKPFMRWKSFWQNCLNEDGTFMDARKLYQAADQKKRENTRRASQKSAFAAQSNWSSMGLTDFRNRSSNSANLGRINVVAVDPNNSNTYYVGAPAGGLWKSVDGGNSWTPLTDELPQIGVSAIAIDPTNSNIIYIGTGDDDANDTNSIGVLKSTDGGQTWNNTGLSFNSNQGAKIGEIYIDRTNGNNSIFVGSSEGFYRSTNGGSSFSRTLNADINDMKLKPGNANIIYAVTDSRFYKSTNNGQSFSQVSSGLPSSSNRLVLDVTPADPNLVYVLSAGAGYAFQGLYKSTNSGSSFTRTANNADIFGSSQAWYDLAIGVSDTNPNEIYVGVLDVYKSSNGGDSFTKINRWFQRTQSYTHADIHFLRFFDGALFCGSDGGVFRSTNGGSSFTDLSVGLDISQFYKVSVSPQNSMRVAGGTQDNGSFGLTSNGQWSNYGGGDGMDAAIDPTNQDHYYGFMQFGQNLWVSYDAGVSQAKRVSGPVQGNWITPLDFNSQGELYAGYDALYRLDGNSFTKVSSSFSRKLDEIEIDPNNSNNIYVSAQNVLYKSTNKGVSFSQVQSFSSRITSVEINNNNGNIVYVATAGSSGKIYRSTNGASSFTDITGNLPSIAKLDIEHHTGAANNPIYIGTSIGVYRRDDTMSGWEPFDTNLPNAPVTDLEINVNDGNITAATYGRGIWRSPLTTSFTCTAERPAGLQASNVTHNTATISWPEITATSYDLRYRVEGTTNWTTVSNITENNRILNGLTAVTAYQAQVRSKCPDGSISNYSTSVNFTTTEFQLEYCDANGANATEEYIGNVQVGDIDHDSQNASNGYGNHTSISTELTKGDPYTISVTAVWTGGKYNEAYSVWIDYNKDGDFADSGEQVWTQAPTQDSPVSGSFTIPDNVATGNTRMRVIMRYNTAPSSCGSFNYGEVEDYTVIIKDKFVDTEAPSVPTGLEATNVEENTLTLSWNASTDNVGVKDYDVYQDEIKIATVTGTTLNVTGLQERTAYEFKVTASDEAENISAASEVLTVTTKGSGCVNGVSAFPYAEGFENTFGSWTQSSSDNLDWRMRQGTTPSNGTGPTAANEGSYYLYVEASGNGTGYPNKQAILTSPCFDLTGKNRANFTFKYHMYGADDMGSIAVEASTDQGATWTQVWRKTGNQGNTWLSANIDLSAYLDQGLQLRFNRITGATWKADIAIDQVRFSTDIEDGGCTDVTLTINFDDYPEEISWEIINQNNETVLAGGNYGSQPDGSTVQIVECLDPGTYTLVVRDSYGDGLCCNYGSGSYELATGNSTLASGGQFGSFESTTFVIGDSFGKSYFESVKTTDPVKTQIFPIPVGQDRLLKISSNKESIPYTINDALGRTLLQGVITGKKQIDVRAMPSGMYIITLDVGKPWIKRFIID